MIEFKQIIGRGTRLFDGKDFFTIYDFVDAYQELDQEKLPILLTNKYQSLEDAKEILGDVANISKLFIDFQQHLYKEKAS